MSQMTKTIHTTVCGPGIVQSCAVSGGQDENRVRPTDVAGGASLLNTTRGGWSGFPWATHHRTLPSLTSRSSTTQLRRSADS
jgi:hypothetical protein